jgi:SsrA-binding protein
MSDKKKPAEAEHGRVVCVNKAARRKFEVEETFEAGLVLEGSEVKSLRDGKGSLADAYGRVRNGEVWLLKFHIPLYPLASHFKPDPLRPRKLLLHRREIDRIIGKVQERGWTLVPLKVYFSRRGHAKVLLGLCTGKTGQDRRQDIMEREAKREAERAIKERLRK